MNQNVQLEFIGFEPDSEIRNFVSTVAEEIHYRAPSDAAMKLAIENSLDTIKATCNIASHAGNFVAEAVTDNPIRAVQQIEEKLTDQLDAWKTFRFQS